MAASETIGRAVVHGGRRVMSIYKNRYVRARAQAAARERRRVAQLTPRLLDGLGCASHLVWLIVDPPPPHVHRCTANRRHGVEHHCRCGFTWTTVL